MPSKRILDHLIHLTRPGSLDATVELFEELGFSVVMGGKHADGLTENALVVLEDGVYLELISFVHERGYYEDGSKERSEREGHWWAKMREGGWIDWSLLDTAEDIHKTLGAGVEYQEGQEGGRIKTNGDELRWKVTFPGAIHGRGGVPFFCKDLTDRKLRVPTENREHRNGAVGIAVVELLASTGAADRLARHLDAVLCSPSEGSSLPGSGSGFVWEVSAPQSHGSRPVIVKLVTPASPEHQRFVEETSGGFGIWSVTCYRPRSTSTDAQAYQGFKTVDHIKFTEC